MREAEFHQAFVGFLVRQVVRDMCEPRAPGFQFLDQRQGLFDGLVHGVGDVTQCVENQFVETFKQGHRRIRNGAEVGQISGACKAKTKHFHIAVQQGDRRKGNTE